MSAAEDCPKFGSLLKVFKAKVAEMEQACADEHDHSEDEAPAVEPVAEESDPAPAPAEG